MSSSSDEDDRFSYSSENSVAVVTKDGANERKENIPTSGSKINGKSNTTETTPTRVKTFDMVTTPALERAALALSKKSPLAKSKSSEKKKAKSTPKSKQLTDFFEKKSPKSGKKSSDTTPKKSGEKTPKKSPKKSGEKTAKKSGENSVPKSKEKSLKKSKSFDSHVLVPQSPSEKTPAKTIIDITDSPSSVKSSSSLLNTPEAAVVNTPKSSKKKSTPGKIKKPGKPTYVDMVQEAILALKDRTGSSVVAISKWLLANQDHLASVPKKTFKNNLANGIKLGVKEERLIKVKSSYKVSTEWLKKQKAATKAAEAAKKKAELKRLKELKKAKLAKKKKKEAKRKKEELAKKRAEKEKEKKEVELTPEQKAAEEEKKRKREEAERKKAEEAARKKYIADRLKKRKYPMDDLALHAEDKELGLKPPDDVTKRPTLPYTLGCLVPPDVRAEVRPSSAVVNASSCGNGTMIGGNDNRGLITDALHVFHFFCGDVGFNDERYPVPQFSVKTLLYAIEEVLNGNSKSAKALPPLLNHLFLTALKILTAPKSDEDDEDDDEDDQSNVSVDGDPVDARLEKDLAKLREGLNAVSWSQTCMFYFDLQERFYSSDASLEANVPVGGKKVDMSYLLDGDIDSSNLDSFSENANNDTQNCYLGDANGSLAKGFAKLQKQVEPWNIPADELLAMLRALTDDILWKEEDLAEDIVERIAKLNELQKAKKAAESKFRKVKLAYEGPKKPTKQKKSDNGDSKKDNKEEKDGENQTDAKETTGSDKASDVAPFVPTATKQEFQAAEKAFDKANDAYENGLRKLVSRTVPVGLDRNFNAVYFFRNDPELLHVEELKNLHLPTELSKLDDTLNQNRSWRCIDTKALFEQFLGSLDIRGVREHEVYEECVDLNVLRRRLLDDSKEKTRAVARQREREDLERKLSNAKLACEANERNQRSGRLAGLARDEVKKMEEELEALVESHQAEELEEQKAQARSFDYSLLTGLDLIANLDTEEDEDETSALADTPCYRLWTDGCIDVLVEALLEMEENCNNLSSWKRKDMTRKAWRKQLSDLSNEWMEGCKMKLGSSTSNAEHDSTEDPKSKKQKTEGSSSDNKEKSLVKNVLTVLKKCLVDLELRLFSFSGLKVAMEAKDTIEETGNDSSDEDEDTENAKADLWKMKINALKSVPNSRNGLVRDIIIAAITVARKAHLNQIAGELKTALQLYRPQSARQAKLAAIAVLDKHGGYDASDDENEDVDFDEVTGVDTVEQKPGEGASEQEISSMVCEDVTMMRGCLNGDDSADRSDWLSAVKSCKSISRLAALIQCFLSKSDELIDRIVEEKEALDSLLGLESSSKRSRSSKRKHDSSTPVWCDSSATNIVKAKVKGYPWWPSYLLQASDPAAASALKDQGHCLVSFVGEPNIYMVDDSDVMNFLEEIDESMESYEEDVVENLQESTMMARKLWRKKNRGMGSPWRKKSKSRFVEEKKSGN